MQSVVSNMRLTIQNNRDVIIEQLRTFSDVIVTKPAGTFYCLPDFRAYGSDSVKLAEFLLERALVVTVPGKEFGMEGYIRLSFSGSAKDIIEGIKRTKWALDPNAPNDIYIGDRKLIRDWL
jgi:aspartate aminotransferase